MARKRSSGARTAAKRAKPKPKPKPPEGWIRIVWGRVVRPRIGSGAGDIQLRLKRRPGAARTIALTYALTKKALDK